MAVDVLVTGAAGALGHSIVDTLRSANHNVVACGRAAGDDVDAIWDISQEEVPSPDFTPSVVVHGGARIGIYQQSLSGAISLFDVNVAGTLRVVRWCVSKQVELLVLISGAIVYGEWNDSPKSEEDPVMPWKAGAYAVSKLCSEQVASLLMDNGGKVAILRLSSLYGPRYSGGLIPRMLRQSQETGRIHLEPPFDDAFDLLHVSDAARTVQLAVEQSRTGLWNIGSGSLCTIREVADTCARHLNAQVTLSDEELARPARIINWVDDRKAREELGHTSLMSLDLGIEEIARSLGTEVSSDHESR